MSTSKEKKNTSKTTATSNTNTPNDKPVTKKSIDDSVMTFSPEEFDLLNTTNEELNIDSENFEDVKTVALQDTSERSISDKELDDIVRDPKYKTTITRPGETPSILNALGPNDRLGKLTDEDVKQIKDRNEKDRKNLIVLLASKPYINLDIKIGVKEGKSVYMQKQFFFNSLNKQEELHLKLKNSRLTQISHKYQKINARAAESWTDQESEFLMLAPAMVEIIAYQFSEYEAKLRLGMSPEDFARVDIIQYGLALQVIAWHTMNPSFSSLGQ